MTTKTDELQHSYATALEQLFYYLEDQQNLSPEILEDVARGSLSTEHLELFLDSTSERLWRAKAHPLDLLRLEIDKERLRSSRAARRQGDG